ncbi:MAG: GDP-mannose 4,6-dehydratase [Candidatus Andersenbacteria bacterium]|nr:GDP-mannose 4,6-dehydratase [Candidatus Andersenbacteria bacterium]MBI3250246.1 GDP-mannose 4,6-dehydratase [Candidatus Andersenbacteria bacterium]
MSILITGGAGFIGSHIAHRLVSEGEEVVLADIFTSQVYPAELKRRRVQALVPEMTIHNIDICNAEEVAEFISKIQPSVIIHLAAHASVTDSVLFPREYMETNSIGTLNIVRAATRTGSKVVLASSSTIYEDVHHAVSEHEPAHPLSPYGLSKQSAEQVARLWHDLYGVSTAILRLFSVYGPWGRPDMAPQLFTEAILHSRRCAVTVGAGRDYVYIDDVVEAFLAVAMKTSNWEVLNIGSGVVTPLTSLVETIGRSLHKIPEITMSVGRPGEMKTTAANITAANEHLGWEPTWPLKAGIDQLVSWYVTAMQKQRF